VRPLPACAAFLALACACGGGGAGPGPRAPEEPARHTDFAEEDRYVPAYGKPELSRALIAERGAEATAEQAVAALEAKDPRGPGDDDRLRVALGDLAVRRRFIATLEACEASGRWCPPRLDDPPWAYDPDPDRPADPPLEATLRFDLASWQKVAAELHGRACACRTLACVDSVGIAIDRLEGRPMPEVQSDDAAALSITRARECLFRLRGRTLTLTPRPPDVD
jgi:hypothetical protein